jgi:hypothetical protein
MREKYDDDMKKSHKGGRHKKVKSIMGRRRKN